MRDFQNFTTQYGVASLILHEIPYRKTAYIQLLRILDDCLWAHLEECADFCRAAGAERVFVSDFPGLDGLTPHSEIYRMVGEAAPDYAYAASLFPVTQSTVSQWREIYNQRMNLVDHARTIERRDDPQLIQSSGAYFVHRDGTLLGIGWLEDNTLLAVAAVVPGEGKTVMNTLMSLREGERLTLEVASTNARAISLYEKLGFCKTEVVRKWYLMPEKSPTKNQQGVL